MSRVTEKAYAKINISLDVGIKRPDGYHDMLMVMQTVSLCDEVTVEIKEGTRSRAETNLYFIPTDERNLAVRAANAFFRECGMEGVCAEIKLIKQIPVCAGLGGGSADAAAVLRALNILTGKPLSKETLCGLASKIGSDVAFCVSGGTYLASGRGDTLDKLPSMPDCGILVVKPEFSISTPELFRKLDSVKLRCHPDTLGICRSLENSDIGGIAHRMYNVFEDVPDRRMKSIAIIKSELLDAGSIGSVMTGTGSAVFGIFEDLKSAQKAEEKLRDRLPFCRAAVPVKELGE